MRPIYLTMIPRRSEVRIFPWGPLHKMTPSTFTTKLDKLLNNGYTWVATYDTLSYQVAVYRNININKRTVKSDSIAAFGIATSLEKAFEDCLKNLKKRLVK